MTGRTSSGPLAEETRARSSSSCKAPAYSLAEELLGVRRSRTPRGRLTLDDVACSRPVWTRTDTQLLEEESLAQAETAFLFSYAVDTQRKWEPTSRDRVDERFIWEYENALNK